MRDSTRKMGAAERNRTSDLEIGWAAIVTSSHQRAVFVNVKEHKIIFWFPKYTVPHVKVLLFA